MITNYHNGEVMGTLVAISTEVMIDSCYIFIM